MTKTRQTLAAALVALVLVPATLAAQETTLITIPTKNRVGVEVTPSITVPMDAVGVLRLSGVMPDSDFLDTRNSLKVRVYMNDGGVWRLILGFGWQGGAYTGPDGEINPRPHVDLDPAEWFRGRELRAEIEVPVRMQVGGTLAIVPREIQ